MSAADPGDYIEADPVTFKAARDEYKYGADPLRYVTVDTSYSDSLRAAAVEAMAAQTTSCATPPGESRYGVSLWAAEDRSDRPRGQADADRGERMGGLDLGVPRLCLL